MCGIVIGTEELQAETNGSILTLEQALAEGVALLQQKEAKKAAAEIAEKNLEEKNHAKTREWMRRFIPQELHPHTTYDQPFNPAKQPGSWFTIEYLDYKLKFKAYPTAEWQEDFMFCLLPCGPWYTLPDVNTVAEALVVLEQDFNNNYTEETYLEEDDYTAFSVEQEMERLRKTLNERNQHIDQLETSNRTTTTELNKLKAAYAELEDSHTHSKIAEEYMQLSSQLAYYTEEIWRQNQKIAELEDDLEASSEGYETMRQHVEQRLTNLQIGMRSLAGQGIASWLAGGLAVLDVLIDQTKHDLSDNATYRLSGRFEYNLLNEKREEGSSAGLR
jgi:hypothetical protein